MRRRSVLLSAALLFAAACGSSDSSSVTGTNNNNGGSQTGPITATLDGKSWAGASASASYSSSIAAFAGYEISSGTTISAAAHVTGPGTYSLSFGNPNAGIAIITQSGASWSTAYQGGGGTLVITTLTTNHLVATFSFDALQSAGGAVRHVVNGKIDATF